MRPNSAALEAFAKVEMMMINYTGVWNDNLAWYSLNASNQIYLHSFEHSLKFHDFRFTWPCLINEVLVTQAKFLQPSSKKKINTKINFDYGKKKKREYDSRIKREKDLIFLKIL